MPSWWITYLASKKSKEPLSKLEIIGGTIGLAFLWLIVIILLIGTYDSFSRNGYNDFVYYQIFLTASWIISVTFASLYFIFVEMKRK